MNRFAKTLGLLLAFSLLLCTGCALQDTPAEPVSGPAFDGAEYIRGSGAALEYLSAREFSSDRTPGSVSPTLAADMAQMGLGLLRACEGSARNNVLISPLSVMTALAMTANGARGSTLSQLCGFMGTDGVEALNTKLFDLYAALPSDENAAFGHADSVWITSLPFFSVNNGFVKLIGNTYDAEIAWLDYSKSQDAADAVNGWCRDKTEGMIEKVVDADMYNGNTVMTLVNALYFDALWKDGFTDAACYDGVFHGTGGDQNAQMMRSTESTYIKGKNETGFIKYYEGGKYAFMALLPDKNTDIGDYLGKLDGTSFADLAAKRSGKDVIAVMPAFSADYEVELKEVLISLGVTDAFDPEKADLSGLGRVADGNVCIDRVIHKTHIDVDPSGTRAAAVTAVIALRKTAAEMPPKYEVVLDRPFVYAIIDTQYNTPVFMGVCENIG